MTEILSDLRSRARPWWVVPLAIYLASRVVGAVVLLLTDHDQLFVVPVGERTPQNGPGYFTATGNWDGAWYEQIARHGYPDHLPRDADGDAIKNAWAFYPLFPALARGVMEVTRLPFPAAAGLLSIVLGAVAICLLFRMLSETADPFTATTTVLALSLFPAAVVLQAAYTESLALLLIVGVLLALRRRRYGWVALLCLLLALTRAVVLPVAGVIGLHLIARYLGRHRDPFPLREQLLVLATGAFAVASYAIWPVVTGIGTGESGAYVATQQAWIRKGATGWPAWVSGVVDPDVRLALGLGLLALAALAVVVLRREGRAWGFELRAWSLVYAVYLLVATRPTPSMIRYAMLAIIPWWPLPTPLGERAPARRTKVAIVVLIVVVGVATQAIWTRLVFIAAPGDDFYP